MTKHIDMGPTDDIKLPRKNPVKPNSLDETTTEPTLGPGGYGPGHPKYEGPKSGKKEPSDTKNDAYNALFDKLNVVGEKIENYNNDVVETIKPIQNVNGSER